MKRGGGGGGGEEGRVFERVEKSIICMHVKGPKSEGRRQGGREGGREENVRIKEIGKGESTRKAGGREGG